MQMGNGFASVGTIVNHDAEARIEIELLGEVSCGEEEMAEQGLVFGSRFTNARDELLGHDQHMHGGLRLHIVKGDTEVVLVRELRGDLTIDDFLKDGLGHDRKG